jgi:transposase
MAISSIWKMLQKEGFVLKAPRPKHRKSSEEAASAFKKTS